MQHAALHNRLTELATEVGRLRRRLPEGSTAEWTAERIAFHIEDCILMLEPSAAQLVAHYAPGDESAITEAIRIVDERSQRLRHTLGLNAA